MHEAFPNFNEAAATGMVGSAPGAGGGLPLYLGITMTAAEAGSVTAELEVTPELLNPFGAAHGGVLSALVDHVLGAVCIPVIPAGAWPATTEYKLNLLAPARVGTMQATSTIVTLSQRTAVVRVDVTNNGRLVGVAQGTVSVLPLRVPADDTSGH